jgi:hypothetical protein
MRSNTARDILCPLAAFLFVAGCSAAVDHPSLAQREVERLSATEATPPPPPPVAIPEDASLQERTAALVARARTADAHFNEALSAAHGAISGSAGASPGSENWVQAQQALSRADTLRTPVTESLADLAAMQITAAQSGLGADTSAALSTAISDVSAIDTNEREAIRALENRLSAP